MALTPPTGFLEGLLCSLGKIVEFILIELAIVVAELFGFPAGVTNNLMDAEAALAAVNCFA